MTKRINSFSKFQTMGLNLFTVRICGFTLAEVLITLGIIGVVCTMTILTLMNNVQDVQFKTAYKKAFSALSQALTKANADYLMVPTSYTTTSGNNADFLMLMNQFKVSKKCINNNNAEC